MDRRLLPILPLLGLALMGNSCDFRASVNNPPPASAEDGERPRSGNGLLVVVRRGDAIGSTGGAGSESTQALVAAALSISTLASPAYSVEEGSAEDGSGTGEATPEPIRVESSTAIGREPFAFAPISLSASAPSARPASVVPEPGGLLLFACGLGLAASRLRRRATEAG